MVKVIMNVEGNRKVKLIPEQTPLVEVINQFQAFRPGSAYSANGERLQAEDFDKPLREFAKDDEVALVHIPFWIEAQNDPPEQEPATGLISAENAKMYAELARAKEAIEEVMRSLNEIKADSGDNIELPF